MYPGKKWCYGCGQLFVFVFALLLDAREIRFVWWSVKFFPSCPEFRTMLSVTVEMDKIWTNYELLESTCSLYLLIWSLLPHLSGVLNDRCETVDLDFWQNVFEQTWFEQTWFVVFSILERESFPKKKSTSHDLECCSVKKANWCDGCLTTKHDNVNEKKLFMILATDIDIWYDKSVHCNMNANRRKT